MAMLAERVEAIASQVKTVFDDGGYMSNLPRLLREVAAEVRELETREQARLNGLVVTQTWDRTNISLGGTIGIPEGRDAG